MIGSLLTQRCAIARAVETTSAAGEPVRTVWQRIAENVPCRAWMLSAKEMFEQAQGVTIKARVYLRYGQDVRETDRIENLVGEDGTVLITIGDIEGVNRDPGAKQSHVEIELNTVRTNQ